MTERKEDGDDDDDDDGKKGLISCFCWRGREG